MKLVVRDYHKTDFSSLLSLAVDEWKEVICPTVMSMKTDNTVEKCLVAEDNGNVVGFVYGFVLPNKTLLLEFLYVTPACRGNGIGVALIKELEIRSECNVSQIFYNKSLHKYYEKQGYQAGDNLEVAIKELGGSASEI